MMMIEASSYKQQQQQNEKNQATHSRQFLQSDEIIQENPKEFREVPQDYFDIKDEKQIEELSNIIKQNFKNKKQSFQVNGLQSKSESKQILEDGLNNTVEKNFTEKANNLFNLLDNCKRQIEKEKSEQFQEQKYLYYNLEDIEYNNKEVISEAFSFLRDLEKKEKEQKKKEKLDDDQQIIEEEFDILTFKPTYQQSQKKMSQQSSIIKNEESKLKKRIKNLTIEDDEDDYEDIEEQKE